MIVCDRCGKGHKFMELLGNELCMTCYAHCVSLVKKYVKTMNITVKDFIEQNTITQESQS